MGREGQMMGMGGRGVTSEQEGVAGCASQVTGTAGKGCFSLCKRMLPGVLSPPKTQELEGVPIS